MFYVKLYLQAVQPQISSGLRIRRIRGSRCRAIRRCSRVCEGSKAIICAGSGPRCVIKNM